MLQRALFQPIRSLASNPTWNKSSFRAIAGAFSTEAAATTAQPEGATTTKTATIEKKQKLKTSPLSIVSHPFDLKNESKPLDIPETSHFAVVLFQGKQYKVTKDDRIVAEEINEDKDIGESVDLNEVLLIASEKGTIIGRPRIADAIVKTVIEEKTLDKKVLALKFRRRKNSKRLRGYRRNVTTLRVIDIVTPPNYSKYI